ncbi:MAG: type II toxin-antitoxin system RelE/ParE family toxin [Coriobacteriia bacterium]
MEIAFATTKLEKNLATESARSRKFGAEAAKLLYRRMVQLHDAPNAHVMLTLPGRCHELSGDRKGQLAVEVTKGLRLVFEPSEHPPPLKDDGGLDLAAITAITILEVTDYHG